MGVMSEIDLALKYHYPDERKKQLIATSSAVQVMQNTQPVHQSVQSIDPCTALETVSASEVTPTAVNIQSQKTEKKKRYYKKRDNENIIRFLQHIQASPNFANSFKVLKAKGQSGFKTIVFYKQNEGCEIINNVYFGKRNYYITKNSYTGNYTRGENLFSLDNIVIDIDNHNISAKEVDREVERLLYFLDTDYDGKMPEYGITRTGRGLQLWIGLESMAATPKLIYRYEQLSAFFCKFLSEVIQNYDINLAVDVPASTRVNGFVRLPETINMNRKGNYKISYERFPLIKYQWQELLEEYTDIQLTSSNSNSNKYIKSTKQKRQSHFQKINSESDYTPFVLKQIRFIKKLVELNKGNVDGRREMLLFHFCNATMKVYDAGTAEKMTKELNQMFSTPLNEAELRCAVKSPQKKCYNYSKVRFLADICANDDEKKLYYESTENRTEERQKARERKIQRNQKIIQLKEQGMLQKTIAEEVGCNPDTVGAVLKEYNENGRVKRDKQIITLYQKGMKVGEIAKRIGYSQTVINKALQAVRKAIKAERNAKIIALHQQGMIAKKIAEQIKCSKRTIDSIIAEYKKENTKEQGLQKKPQIGKSALISFLFAPASSRCLKTKRKSWKIARNFKDQSKNLLLNKVCKKNHKSEKPP